MDYTKELLDKSTQGAQLLMSDLRELHHKFIKTNPLAAELFIKQVVNPASNLLNTLYSLNVIVKEQV